MYFSKRNQETEETIIEDTAVFACETEECNGWMRAQFLSDDSACPLCGGTMQQETRQLPKIT
ncbi:MAG: cold-inducible protein YdjO-related protein [Bacillus sp. (in: firmicutes)]